MSDSNDDEANGTGPPSTESDADEDSAFRDVLQQVARAEPRTPPVFLAEGTRLGPYTVMDRLGRGGMGVVYRAVDTRLNREVALKVLRGSVAGDERRRRFLREARSAAAINHPNVAIVFEVGEAGDHIFLAMELIEGETLRARLAGGGLGAAEGARIAREISMGLVPAHAKGIVHRDLKPENVMITPRGGVKVLDFGLAKLRASAATTHEQSLGNRETETRDGTVLGTPAYMAPEQAMGEQTDARADVFALGVLLYELVTGTRPGLLGAGPVIEDERIAEIVRGAIASSPADRFTNASEMLAAFDTLFSQPPASGRPSFARGTLLPTRSEPTPDAFERPAKRVLPTRRRWMIAIAALCLGALVYPALRLSRPDRAIATPSRSTEAAPLSDAPTAYFERRLTAYSSATLVTSLAVSTDGLFYAYIADDVLHVAAVDGSARNRVTLPVGEKGLPRELQFFPDGKRLLAGSFAADDEHTWILSLDGAPSQRGPTAIDFVISPDGGRIAYRHLTGIYVAPIAGGKATYIESISKDERAELAWSPDGGRLAISRVVDSAALLEIARADGTSHKTVTSDIQFEIDLTPPTWTANDRVAFENVAADHSVAIMEVLLDAADAPRAPPRRLWARPAAHLDGLQYRNGRFFFIRTESQLDLYLGRMDAHQRFEKRLSRYTMSDNDDRFVGWMPDGRAVYNTDIGGSSRVLVTAVANKEDGIPVGGPDTAAFGVLADGSIMALIHQRGIEAGTVSRLDAGGAAHDLFDLRDVELGKGLNFSCVKCASKSASSCVLGTNEGEATSFSVFNPITGSRGREFARLDVKRPWRCSVSPDGNTLYLPGDDAVRAVTVSTGVISTMSLHSSAVEYIQYVGFIPGSSDFLVSGAQGAGHEFILARMSADGARTEPLWTSDTLWVWAPQIAPNGRDVAVNARSVDTDVYMLAPADAK